MEWVNCTLFAFLICSSTCLVQGADFYLDAATGQNPGAGCPSSEPCSTLQELIDQTVLSSDNEVNWIIAAGVHSATTTRSLELSPSVLSFSITGAGIGVSTLSGLSLETTASSVTIEDITISDTENRAFFFSNDTSTASAVLNRMEMRNVTDLSSQGGGVYTLGSISVTDSIFTNCYSGGTGGCLSVFPTAPTGPSSVTRCEFRHSYSADSGGAIRPGNYEFTITDSVFHNCSSGGGGGALAGRTNSVELLTISGSTFTECSANNGGALQLQGESLIENCLFESNVATLTGGAMRVRFHNTTIRDSEFIDNSADKAGSVAWEDVPDGVFASSTITNSRAESLYGSARLGGDSHVLFHDITITGGYSGSSGGGIQTSLSGKVTLSGLIIVTDNTVGTGGGGLRIRSNMTVLPGARVRVYGNTDETHLDSWNVFCEDINTCAKCGVCTAGYCDLMTGECLCAAGASADSETGDCLCNREGAIYDPVEHECILQADDVEENPFPFLPVAIGSGVAVVVVLGGMLLLQRRYDDDESLEPQRPKGGKKSGQMMTRNRQKPSSKPGTVEHAIQQLIAKVPVDVLNNYARDLLKDGHKKEALALIVRLEPVAQKKAPAGEYIQVLQTYTDVLEANELADGVNDVKAAKRATMQLDQNTPLGGGRALQGKGVDKARNESNAFVKKSKKAAIWDAETVVMSSGGDGRRKNSGARKGSKSSRGGRGRKGSKSSRGRKGPAEDVVSLMPPRS